MRLPGGKHVIVDAKVPLAAYLDALRGDRRRRAGARTSRRTPRQVREHVAKLSAKSYWQQFGDTPDFVVMFLPDEGVLPRGLGAGPVARRDGVRSRVHIASPTTLIVLLQSIAYGWQQESVAEDAREIQALGRELYERVAIVGGHLAKIGKQPEERRRRVQRDRRLARAAVPADRAQARASTSSPTRSCRELERRRRAAEPLQAPSCRHEQLRAIDAA